MAHIPILPPLVLSSSLSVWNARRQPPMTRNVSTPRRPFQTATKGNPVEAFI